MIDRVVLVHGAWHGAWCWDAVVQHLTERDIHAVAVDLPSVTRADATLADDADEVRPRSTKEVATRCWSVILTAVPS